MSTLPETHEPTPEHKLSEPNTSEPRRPGRLLQLVALVGVAGLLGLLVWDTVHQGSGAKLVAEIRDGKAPSAPLFTLPVLWAHDETWPQSLRTTLGDGRVALAELRGHPVVLNIWASWCILCKDEAPRLVASAPAHASAHE